MNFKWSCALFMSSLLLSVISVKGHAQQPNKATLKIKPVVCMVKSIGQVCEMTIAVDWTIPSAQDVCLYKDNAPLQCWKNQRKARTNISIAISEDMSFSLRNENMHVLAEQKVKINAAASRKYRRKLKSDWSFF
ncbi:MULTISPECIES: DUF3019 domain-containing protein [Pseudoalteromonas]|uniref:DUF3019 domain-containing protein n=1 Tax=Pseudoalteromonas obscura TaxID=3048491 RepID=A0ABT7EM31_9GAMM|nr:MULTISPECIES: DUF3019 domain-containing protein [Pseudoalteromonas]MBQ4837935.1 DUF3019 domain-containing protein [Pseudoalteromonas luteoviolacea]MDK2596119.1 DUF3019 domain-containing protein [Pseudoalteromonas sp. P94(2023)]